MEPTSKALQTLAGAVRENTQGVGRSPLDVLQVINLKADLQSREGGFKDLLQAETGRADARRASRSGTPEPANRPPERQDTQAGRAGDGSKKPTEGSETAETGKSSPAADRNLPPASEGNTAQQANNADSGEHANPDAESGDVPEQAASAEETDTQATGQAESEVATDVGPQVPATSEESPVGTNVSTEGEAESAQTAATDEQPVAGQTNLQEGSDDAEVVPVAAETEIPADPEILPDAEDVAVAAGPAVTGNGTAKTGLTGRENAAERVAANLERNPEAAGDGLRRAQEAIAQAAAKGTPAITPATPEAAGRSATTGGIEIAGREIAGRATDVPTPREAPTVELQPAAPRSTATPAGQLPFTGELNPQQRMPAAAAAQQAEQALAAKAMVGEVIEAKISAAANATATTVAATTQAATTTPAQATEAARAALQQVRASFARPGWDQAMAQRVAQLAARGVQSAQIEVDPPELGPVKVVIQVNNDNQTSVSFSSPHAGVREALEQTAQRLREALAEGGMDLVDVEVSDQSAERRESADDAQDREPGTGARAWRSGDTDADADAPVTVMVRDSDALVDHYV